MAREYRYHRSAIAPRRRKGIDKTTISLVRGVCMWNGALNVKTFSTCELSYKVLYYLEYHARMSIYYIKSNEVQVNID